MREDLSKAYIGQSLAKVKIIKIKNKKKKHIFRNFCINKIPKRTQFPVFQHYCPTHQELNSK